MTQTLYKLFRIEKTFLDAQIKFKKNKNSFKITYS